MTAVAEEHWTVDDTEALDDDGAEPQRIRYEIAAYPTDFTIQVLHHKWRDGQLVIPDFQRSYVWSLTQASRFIDSLLLGLPIPQLFLYRPFSSSKLIVVDGQQRLATIAKFYSGVFSERQVFKLRGVSEEWNGKLYADLGEDDRYRLDDSTLRSIIVRQVQPKGDSSIYQIFERLNTGGTQLNAMEIRKAIYHGAKYTFLETLNKESSWRHLIGRPFPDNRLRDVELVLRVLALASNGNGYHKPMKTFLTDYMESLPSEQSSEMEELGQRFRQASRVLYDRLGERPFHLRSRLNVSALDAVMSTAIESFECLATDLESRYQNLCAKNEFLDSVMYNTSDAVTINRRLRLASELLVDSTG